MHTGQDRYRYLEKHVAQSTGKGRIMAACKELNRPTKHTINQASTQLYHLKQMSTVDAEHIPKYKPKLKRTWSKGGCYAGEREVIAKAVVFGRVHVDVEFRQPVGAAEKAVPHAHVSYILRGGDHPGDREGLVHSHHTVSIHDVQPNDA